MIYLPFSDDLRHPEADPSFTGASNPQADKAQIEAAEAMLHALTLKGFDSADIPNPSLQRHYQVSIPPQFCFCLVESSGLSRGGGYLVCTLAACRKQPACYVACLSCQAAAKHRVVVSVGRRGGEGWGGGC